MSQQEPDTIAAVIKSLWSPHKPELFTPMKNTLFWVFIFIVASLGVITSILDILSMQGFFVVDSGNKFIDSYIINGMGGIVAFFIIRVLSFRVPSALYRYKAENRNGHHVLTPLASCVYWGVSIGLMLIFAYRYIE